MPAVRRHAALDRQDLVQTTADRGRMQPFGYGKLVWLAVACVDISPHLTLFGFR